MKRAEEKNRGGAKEVNNKRAPHFTIFGGEQKIQNHISIYIIQRQISRWLRIWSQTYIFACTDSDILFSGIKCGNRLEMEFSLETRLGHGTFRDSDTDSDMKYCIFFSGTTKVKILFWQILYQNTGQNQLFKSSYLLMWLSNIWQSHVWRKLEKWHKNGITRMSRVILLNWMLNLKGMNQFRQDHKLNV